MSENTALRKATEERDAFLSKHPHLREQQDAIDAILDRCREEDRYQVVLMMLVEQMSKQLQVLNAVKKGLERGQYSM